MQYVMFVYRKFMQLYITMLYNVVCAFFKAPCWVCIFWMGIRSLITLMMLHADVGVGGRHRQNDN